MAEFPTLSKVCTSRAVSAMWSPAHPARCTGTAPASIRAARQASCATRASAFRRRRSARLAPSSITVSACPTGCPPGLLQLRSGFCGCPPGLLFYKGRCVPPNNCPPGMVQLPGGVCFCPAGTLPNNFGQCVPTCPPNWFLAPNGKCLGTVPLWHPHEQVRPVRAVRPGTLPNGTHWPNLFMWVP